MSAKSIQRKIDIAHQRVGKKLGYGYTVYRPVNNIDVLDESNIIGLNVKSTFTLNDSYTSAMGWGIPVWMCYTNASLIQAGDFLYSESEGRTFFVLDRKPHLPVMTLEVNDRINVQTIGYSDGADGFGPGVTTFVARNLPAYVSYGSSSIGATTPARNLGESGVRVASVITTLPRYNMVMGTSVTLADGFQGDVVAYDYSSVGSALRLTAKEFVVA